MCGLIGLLGQCELPQELISKGLESLKHRGPDGEGIWVDKSHGVALGHTRLGIVGREDGQQPMLSSDENIITVVNGEFYEYENIKKLLEDKGCLFHTASDSELLIHLYRYYGDDCIKYLRGEFSFILWDKNKKLVFCARDRFGIKPLYYSYQNECLYFASEAKALFSMGVKPAWNYDAYAQHLFLFHTSEQSLFSNINQIPPGHKLIATHNSLVINKYWDIDYPIEQDDLIDANEYIAGFHEISQEAVSLRTNTDLPFGVFLSSGIDSSAVLGYATNNSHNNVCALHIDFQDSAYSEVDIAKESAKFREVEFNPIIVDQQDIADVYRQAVVSAESIGNLHGAARYINCLEAKRQAIKLALTGEGADEALAGYSHFRNDCNSDIPKDNNKSTLKALVKIVELLGFCPAWISKLALERSIYYMFLNKEFMMEYCNKNFYSNYVCSVDIDGQLKGRSFSQQSRYLWCKLVLPSYVLVSDRLEMANSIECRQPFLDHKWFEYAKHCPDTLLFKGRYEKYILREAAKHVITKNAYESQKRPFAAPSFLSNDNDPVYTLLHDNLRSQAFLEQPFFDRVQIINTLDTIKARPSGEIMALEKVFLTVLCTIFLQQNYNLY